MHRGGDGVVVPRPDVNAEVCVTETRGASQSSRMRARLPFGLCALLAAALGCGGKIAEDDADAIADSGVEPTRDTAPDVPKDEAGDAEYASCDDLLTPSWQTGCSGEGVEHGELCATPSAHDACLASTTGCDGPSPDMILLGCDPGFFSRAGAKMGVDIDANGCVTSVEWSNTSSSVIECALAQLTAVRFPCTGSTTIVTPCIEPK